MKKIFQNNTIYFSCNKVTLYVNVYIISYLTLISQKQDILSSLVRKDINLAQSVGYIRFIFISLGNSLKILYSKSFPKSCMVGFDLILRANIYYQYKNLFSNSYEISFRVCKYTDNWSDITVTVFLVKQVCELNVIESHFVMTNRN